MNKLKDIGDVITFNSRRGHVVGYWTGKHHGHANPVQTFYVVDLDRESSGYVLDPARQGKLDMFVSLTLIDVENNDG